VEAPQQFRPNTGGYVFQSPLAPPALELQIQFGHLTSQDQFDYELANVFWYTDELDYQEEDEDEGGQEPLEGQGN
jgi:hypothetical protein